MEENRCLILGGCGFLGSAVTRQLVESGWKVRVFDKEGTDTWRLQSVISSVELVMGDFLNVAELGKVLEGVETVIHFIGTTIPQSSMEDVNYDIETNVLPTLRMLDLLKSAGVKRLLFASSGGTVYGPVDEEKPIPETHQTNPIVAYGISKLMIEKHIQMFSLVNDIPAVILRIANPFGEAQLATRAQGAVAVFMGKIRQGETIHIWGDGSIVRDYIYVEDVAAAFKAVLVTREVNGIFNIGTGKGTRLDVLAEAIGRLFSREVRVSLDPARVYDVPYNVLDISKISRATDWKPKYSLESGLEKMKSSYTHISTGTR